MPNVRRTTLRPASRGAGGLGACCALALVLGLLCGCSSSGGDAGAVPSVSTVQEWTTVADFEAVVAADAALQAVMEMAASDFGLTTLTEAGRMADQDGVALSFAGLTGAGAQDAIVVLHCRGADCVSALQQRESGSGALRWQTPSGAVPVRTIRIPFLLLDVDPNDLSTAAIAPLDEPEDTGSALAALTAAGKADGTPTDPNRKLRFLSAFNEHMTLEGESLDGLADTMDDAGFPDTEAVYGAGPGDYDTQLSTLGQGDALVWLAHATRSSSSGQIVGMSTEKLVWGANPYLNDRIFEQLAKNPNGGPGIIFLAGCLTEQVIPTFDNGQRIVLGFDKKVDTFLVFAAVRGFFKALAAGGTIQDAIDAANETLHDNPKGEKINLKVNTGVDLTQKLVDVGAAGQCSADFARSWEGTVTVTTGTDLVPSGMTTAIRCGDLVMTQTDGVGDDCPACWTETTFKSRPLAGCAEGNLAKLTQFDDGAYIYLEGNLISSELLSVTIEGHDSTEATFTRSGSLTPCN